MPRAPLRPSNVIHSSLASPQRCACWSSPHVAWPTGRRPRWHRASRTVGCSPRLGLFVKGDTERGESKKKYGGQRG